MVNLSLLVSTLPQSPTHIYPSPSAQQLHLHPRTLHGKLSFSFNIQQEQVVGPSVLWKSGTLPSLRLMVVVDGGSRRFLMGCHIEDQMGRKKNS